jgi:hypothetical protein
MLACVHAFMMPISVMSSFMFCAFKTIFLMATTWRVVACTPRNTSPAAPSPIFTASGYSSVGSSLLNNSATRTRQCHAHARHACTRTQCQCDSFGVLVDSDALVLVVASRR